MRLPVIAKRIATQRTEPPRNKYRQICRGGASLHAEDPQGIVPLNVDWVDGADLLVFFEKL